MTDIPPPPLPPPGWYQDPDDATQRRWWDGTKWHEARQPLPTQSLSIGRQQETPKEWLLGFARRQPIATFMVGCLAVALVALGITTAIRGGDSSPNIATYQPPASGGSAVGKYDQTWAQPYDQTTCTDWNGAMDSHEKFVAAADMLTGARNNGDGASGVASDELVQAFEADLTDACVIPSMTITDDAVGIYLTERAKYRP